MGSYSINSIEFFTGRLSPEKIIDKLSIYHESRILSDQTLIIFDEIQNSPLTLTSLKYFCENAPEYHIATAGSLLGVKVGQSAPFPVGKVNFLLLRLIKMRGQGSIMNQFSGCLMQDL